MGFAEDWFFEVLQKELETYGSVEVTFDRADWLRTKESGGSFGTWCDGCLMRGIYGRDDD